MSPNIFTGKQEHKEHCSDFLTKQACAPEACATSRRQEMIKKEFKQMSSMVLVLACRIWLLYEDPSYKRMNNVFTFNKH